ncbi:MAG: NAD(P)-binding domain-containing protein [Sulfitobacter sp.]
MIEMGPMSPDHIAALAAAAPPQITVIDAPVSGATQAAKEAQLLIMVGCSASDGKVVLPLFDMIEASASAALMLKYRRPLYLGEAAHDVTFTVALARRDMEITAELATHLGVALPQGSETLSQLKQAEACGFGARDMAAICTYMRNHNQ